MAVLKGWAHTFAVGVAQPELLKSRDGFIRRRASLVRSLDDVGDLELLVLGIVVKGELEDLLLLQHLELVLNHGVVRRKLLIVVGVVRIGRVLFVFPHCRRMGRTWGRPCLHQGWRSSSCGDWGLRQNEEW